MTAWQDQPPLSRRQVRQNERGETADGRVDVEPENEGESTFGGFAREGWDADARRADSSASSTDEAGSRSNITPVPGGRRAQRAQQPAAPTEPSPPDRQTDASHPLDPEPLNYSTQGRVPQPQPSAPESRRRTLSAVPPSAESTAAGSSRDGDAADGQPIFRVRDFSPEGRRTSFAPTAPAVPPVQRAADLDYRTQGAPIRHLDAAYLTPAVAPAGDAHAAPIEERTMSRRELRALEQSGRLTPPEYDVRPPLVSRRPVAPDSAAPDSGSAASEAAASQSGASVSAGAGSTSSGPVSASSVSPGPSGRDASAFSASVNAPAEPPALVEPPRFVAPPTFVVPSPVTDVPASAEPLLRRRERAREVPHDDRATEALAEFDALAGKANAPVFVEPTAPGAVTQRPADQPDPIRSPAASEPSTFTPPFGHWSTQASIDDDEQFPENTITRNIGATSGAITTNALVIPSLPSEDALRPFGNTGEILITGTIDLPRSMGSTGAHPARYDHSDVDALLEATDREDASDTDSAPVRAIRAVSTHTSTRGIMDTKKPKGNSRLPMILAIAGGAILVAAVVLVVVAMATGIFK